MKHLSWEELRRIEKSWGRLGQEETQRHLLFCRHCRKRAFARPAFDPDETWEPPEASPEGRILGRALKKLEERVEPSLLARDRDGRLCAELVALPAAQRLSALVGESRFARPAVAGWLLDAAEACVASDPKQADHLSGLALVVAKRLPFPWTGLEREALLGRSGTLEGEAWRVRGDLEKAEHATRAALVHLNQIPPSSPERASFCRYLARLRKDQGRDDEALALLARAVDLFEELSEPAKVAECRLEQGWMLLDELESAEALLAFEEAASWWGNPEPFDPWLSARHGLALCLADLRGVERAQSLLAQMIEVAWGRSRLDQMRVAVVEAEVAASLDINEHAASRLSEAWRGLVEEGAIVEGVLAGLDLARLYVEEGRHDNVARLGALLGSLQELMTPLREVVGFVLRFASLHGLAGIEILEEGRAFVARARHNPELPFRPGERPAREVRWAEAPAGLRQELVSEAGLSREVAGRSDDEIALPDRARLAWAAEAAKDVRLVFWGPAEVGADEPVH